MSAYNFFVSGPKFTNFFSPNRGWNVVYQVLFGFSLRQSVAAIFAIKDESCQIGGSKSHTQYHACPRQVTWKCFM